MTYDMSKILAICKNANICSKILLKPATNINKRKNNYLEQTFEEGDKYINKDTL